MRTKTSKKGRNENITSLFALSFFLTLTLISFSLCGCGSGGGGGGGFIPSSETPINPALFSGWEMTNGPFSGMVYSFAIDPTSDKKVYAAVEIGGLFTSDDGGRSWTPIQEGLTNLSISAVAMARDGQTIYVGTKGDGIYKTVNKGGSWSPVNNGLPVDPKTQEYFDVNKLVIDHKDSQIVYAILAWSHYPYRTTNGGNKWEEIGDGLPYEPIMSFTIHPVSTQVLYAGTDANGVYKSENMGVSWDPINGDLPLYVVHFPSLAIDSDKNILYAGSRDYGLWKTGNDGASWQFIPIGDLTGWWDVSVLEMDPSDKSVIYAYVKNVRPNVPDEFDPTKDGIYRTFNSAVDWEKVSFHEHPETIRPVREIVIAPSDGKVVYITTQGEGLFMTDDVLRVDDVNDWELIDNGLVDSQVLSTILDSWDNKIVYAGTEEGFYRTADGGLTWRRKGLEGKTIFALVSDPMNTDIIYAATESGVYRTMDGGDSWSAKPSGYQFNCLAVGKISPDRNLIFGGNAFGTGIYKAEDDGLTSWDQVTWQEKNSGLTDDEKYVQSLAIDPWDPSILYAGTGYRRWPGPETAGKVIKTLNGGDTWPQKWSINEPVCSLAINPHNPQILYAGTYVGLYASSDGGETWEFKDGGLGQKHIRSLAIDPMDSKKVCAGTYEEGVFASIDGGENWTEINQGLTGDLNKRICSLVMDIRDIENPVVYAGTGCGVFKAYK